MTAPKGIFVNKSFSSLTVNGQSEGSGRLVIDNVNENNAGIGDSTLNTTVTALYRYNEAAKAYLG